MADSCAHTPIVESVWKEFISAGTITSGLLRPEIRDSWLRCRNAGVDPHDGICHQLLNTEEINRLLEARKTYLNIVRHFMSHLYEFVQGSGFIVMLADERGYVMEALGDVDTLQLASKVNLIQGACWVEEQGGTNGIGTVLALNRPFQVSGREHFCRKLHSWTCSAAPVLADSGELIGILQMSGPFSAAHLHTLGMVVAAAEAIRDQIRLQRRNRDLSAVNEHLNNIFQNMSDGAVIVDRNGVINQLNPVAVKMFGDQVINHPLEDIISHDGMTAKTLSVDRSCKDVEVMLETASGSVHALVTVRPIDSASGSVIFFNPIQKMKKLANRFGGAQARFRFEDIVGRHEKLDRAIGASRKAAGNVSHVMILGESGTGKELLAQAIHNLSSRRKGPFLALNCAALPRDLIASELFGYIAGVFTGADPKGRPGKFEMASGGTLLLDEIGDMPLDQQALFLRVLQDKQVTRLGSDRVISVDVRVICATNANLLEEVHKGNFRQDLYYRLNVVKIEVPSLRERGDDILILFDYFLSRISARLGVEVGAVAAEVKTSLLNYHWPGNVRELENVVEKMINAADGGNIDIRHLPAEMSRLSAPAQLLPPAVELPKTGLKALLGDQERRLLLELLRRHQGNITRIAKETGLSRNTIYRKMQSYHISRDFRFD